MVEPEKSGGVDPDTSESAETVGWLVKLEITRSRARHEDPAAKVDDPADIHGLEHVLSIIKADFRQLTVPLLGRSERVLPSRYADPFRLRNLRQRWERLLYDKTGDPSLYRVQAWLWSSASDTDLTPERTSDLIDEGSKREPQIDIQIRTLGDGPVCSRDLLGRFHPDHREPNIFDAIDEARRLFEELRRKKNEGGA